MEEYIFIAGTQLTIYGFAWLVANFVFEGNNLIPIIMLCAGIVITLLSMFVMGWIF